MKKVISLLLAISLAVVPFMFTGCNKAKEEVDGANVLNIEMFEAGYGRKFMDDLIKAFEAKNPGVKVKLQASPFSNQVRAAIEAGPKVNKTDLFLTGDSFFDYIDKGQVKIDGVTYPSLLADLSDVYSTKAEGESKTILEKLHPDYRNYHTVNGKQYCFPWAGGMGGLIYNKTMFEENGWTVPRTTNELIALAEKIRKEKPEVYPFVFSTSDSYWDVAYQVWWAQYEGIKEFKNFWQGINPVGVLGPEIMTQTGRLKTLKVMERLLDQSSTDSSKVLTDPKSNSYNFTEAQMNFLMGKAAIMPNGDWLENEMKANFDGKIEIAFMRTPIISDLGEKLGISEAQLIEAIDFIDGVPNAKQPDISKEQLDALKEARKITQTLGVNHNAIIPEYSDAKDLAKDFLRFMASDEGLGIYIKATSGAALPFEYDLKAHPDVDKTVSDFQRTKLDILDDSIIVFSEIKHPLFYKGGLSQFANVKTLGSMESLLSATNPKNRKTAEEIFNINYQTVQSTWNDLMIKAGLY